MALRHFTIPTLFAAMLLSAVCLPAQDYVKKVGVNKSQTEFTVNMVSPDAFLLEISGPADYYWRAEVTDQKDIMIGNTYEDGKLMVDGNYTLQVTPVFKLTEDQRLELRKITDNKDEAALAAFRELHQLPAHVEHYTVYYKMQDGKFADPNLEEPKNEYYAHSWDHQPNPQFIDPPASFASITHKRVHYAKRILAQAEPIAMDNTPQAEDAQVFVDDIVVQGSICVGLDCVNGESFGFDTQRLKENNLRIHFQDTSVSASFPTQDWSIIANDSSNGGNNYLGFEDRSAGRIPFRVEGNAPSDALYVDDGGRIGLGTAAPVVELHMKDGDTPTFRLEQDGSSGFTAQTWDVAGNETNFFVRNVTGGSKLPFKVFPGATTNSFVVDNESQIGIGVQNPTSKLQIESGDLHVKSGNVGINSAPSASNALTVTGNLAVTGNSFLTGDVTYVVPTNVTYFTSTFSQLMKLDAASGNVGIGNVFAPGHLLELGADDAVKPGGGSWSAPSDRRLKEDIRDFEDGLEVLMNIRPVRYRYNGKLNMPTDKEYVGIIAQEMKEVAPYTVRPLNIQGKSNAEKGYLAFDDAPLSYITINAVQEQQRIIEAQQEEIDALKAQLSEMDQLKAQLEALSSAVSELQNQNDADSAPANAEKVSEK